MNLLGKGMYLWKLIYCENGNAEQIASVAFNGGLSHVLVKIATGPYDYNVSANVPAIVQALQDVNIQVWGWHDIWVYEPEKEANKALERIETLGLDGYCIDAEHRCKDNPGPCKTFMRRLSSYINVPVSLSSYRFPDLHPELPWEEFLPHVQYNMPQVYWADAHNPAQQLRKCLDQYERLYAKFGIEPLPTVPTGAAYREHGWQPTVEEINEFMQECVKLNLNGFNFWEWWFARERFPEFWASIAAFSPGEVPVTLTLTEMVDILWREANLRGWNLNP